MSRGFDFQSGPPEGAVARTTSRLGPSSGRGTGRLAVPEKANDRGSARHADMHSTKPDLAGPWTAKSFSDVLGKVEASRSVAYLLVSDGMSEKCIFFPVGGLRLTSIGARRAVSLRDAMRQHPDFRPEMERALSEVQLGGEVSSLEDALTGPIRQVAQDASKALVRDELVDLAAWEDAEFEYREANPPPAIFDADMEAVKLSFGVKVLLAEVKERAAEWKKVGARLGSSGCSRLLLGPEVQKATPGLERALVDAVRRAGSGGCLVDEVLLAGRRTGQDAIAVGEAIIALQERQALRLELRPGTPDPEQRAREARQRVDEIESALGRLINQLVARRRLASAYRALGDDDAAIENLQIVGDELGRRQDLEGAIEVYREILGVAPMAFSARERMATLFQALGKGPEAIKECLTLARQYAELRLLNRAQDRLRVAIKIDLKDPDLRRFLIDTLLAMNQVPAAVKEYEELARMCEQQQRPEEALACYQQVLKLQPGNEAAEQQVRRRARRGAGYYVPVALVALGFLLLGGTSYAVVDRYTTLQAFEEANQRALGHARERRFSEAHRELDDFATRYGYDGTKLEHARLRMRALEGFAARDLYREGRALEAQQEVVQAEQRYGRIVRDLGPTEWRQPAADRLKEIAAQREQAGALAGQVQRLIGAGEHAEAFAAGRRLLREHSWTEAARTLELPIEVQSTPAQAAVEVDGRRLDARTPTTITRPAGRPYELRLSLSGHEPVVRKVDLRAAELAFRLQVPLQRRLRWRFETRGPLLTPPSLGRDEGIQALLVGSDQRVHAIDPQGGVRWTRRLGLFEQPAGPPLRQGRLGIVAESGGTVRAFDLRDGAPLWTRQIDEPGLTTVGALAEGPIVVATRDALWGLDPKDGGEVWRTKLPGRLVGPPELDEAQQRALFLTTEGDLGVVPISTGKLFSIRTEGRPICPPAATPQGCVVALEDGRIALQWTKLRWIQQLPAAAVAKPLYAEERVFVPCGNQLVALSLQDGSTLWSRDFGAPVATPAFANGSLYVASRDGALYALGATSGDVRWTYRTGDELVAAPVVEKGTVLVASSDRTLYAISDE